MDISRLHSQIPKDALRACSVAKQLHYNQVVHFFFFRKEQHKLVSYARLLRDSNVFVIKVVLGHSDPHSSFLLETARPRNCPISPARVFVEGGLQLRVVVRLVADQIVVSALAACLFR